MNFGGIPGEYSQLEEAQIVVLPVPYDKTSTWMKGADKGPDALLEASVNLEWYDIDTGFEVYKKGIYTAESLEVDVSPPEMVSLVEKEVAQYIRNNKFVVTLGGEHSVSIGAAKAHSQYFDEVTVIQLDAHADLRDQYLDSPYNHACVMARIKEFAQVLQVGIRSMDISEKDKLVPGRFVYAKEVIENPKWEENILSRLTKNVYITLDMDVFDPSLVPSTGTPEPGGLFYYDVLAFLRKVSQQSNIVGFDVTELCPHKENKSPDFLAAKLIYQLLSYRFKEE